MKRNIFLALSALYVLNTASAGEEKKVDFRKVNQVLSEVVNSEFKADDLVKSLAIKIDESSQITDSSADLRASSAATVSRTPWDKTAATTLGLAAALKANATNQGGDVAGTITLQGQTDTLKLVRWTAERYLKEATSDSPTPDELRAIQLFKQMKTVATFSELYDVSAELVQLIERSGETDLKFELTPTRENGQVVALALKSSVFTFSNWGFQLTLSLNAHQARVNVEVTGKDDSDSLQKMLVQTRQGLLEIQDRSQKALDQVKDVVKSLAEIYRAATNDE